MAGALRFTREAHPTLVACIGPALQAHADRCEALEVFRTVVQPLTITLD